uniref:Retrovirus-related Pol polyprotein from transposon TNT 1-94-like beta-barrel domain-containing protein n=1 Tax=Ananas comosus var. bracteatus TaxID=296719 RepID=A0A6V7Q3F8_ANACO|nr:unnamed protein product [Ananas comosus var. bracteatus]
MHETKQGDGTVAQYIAELSSLWQELDYCHDFQAKCPDDAAMFQKQIESFYDFLAGLQVEFDPIRVQVRGRDLFPLLKEAYAYVQQEESRGNAMIYQLTFEKSAFSQYWIIDSGASDHMTGASNHFPSYFPSSDKDKVHIAYGFMSTISGKGSIVCNSSLALTYVLHVPSFPTNLLSNRAITRT